MFQEEEIIIDTQKIKSFLSNYTEKLVLENLKKILDDPEFKNACTCDRCLFDMATYALNRLPAKYFVSHQGELQTKIIEFENQMQVDIITTVTKAIEIVSVHPRH